MENEYTTLSTEDRAHPAYFNYDESTEIKSNENIGQDQEIPIPPEEEEEDQGFLPGSAELTADSSIPEIITGLGSNTLDTTKELVTAVAGGGVDAVDSVLEFTDLTGDLIKTGWNKIWGNPLDQTQVPWSEQYEAGSFLDLSISEWVPENKSGLGKMARGLVEFGFLTAATGSVGGAIGKNLGLSGLKLTTRSAAAARVAGFGRAGTKTINFISKGARVAAEGGAAEFISSQSDEANIANLVEEHIPWFPFAEALAIDPEDNTYLARLKSVAAGAGINVVAWQINAFARGRWAFKKAKAAGKSDIDANIDGNKTYKKSLDESAQNAENSAIEKTKFQQAEGKGIDRNGISDPWDTPRNHNNYERVDLIVEKDAPIKNLKVKSNDLKIGGTGKGWVNVWTSSALKRMTRGKPERMKILKKQRDELVNQVFKNKTDSRSIADLEKIVDSHLEKSLDTLMSGGDIAAKFKKLLKEDPHNYRVFADDGEVIRTITPAQKAANELTLGMLADTVQGLSQGAIQIMDDVPIARQYEMVMDAMKTLMIEHKRYSIMWGLDGITQQTKTIPENLGKDIRARLDELTKENEEYFSA